MTWRPGPTAPADVEALVINALDALLPATVRVAGSMVGWSEPLLWVMVSRVGGRVELNGRLERVVIAVQVWAPARPRAWDLASATQIALLSIPDLASGVTRVTVDSGWAHSPLPDTADAPSRYTATFTVHAAGLVA